VIKPWEKISSQPLGDFRNLHTSLGSEDFHRARNNGMIFFVIDSVNLGNVIALTSDQQLVMVEQYRHGSETVELEIPGGMMDTTDLTPEATAERELREETLRRRSPGN